MSDISREAVERLIYIYEVEVDAADFAEVDSSTDKQVVATLRAQVDEIERLKAERDVLRDREKHFASVLSVADRGQYRNDWDAAIRRVVAERDALRKAGDRLSFCAQTSGGTAGTDDDLVDAINEWADARALKKTDT